VDQETNLYAKNTEDVDKDQEAFKRYESNREFLNVLVLKVNFMQQYAKKRQHLFLME